jgi:hypothetical protein
LAGLLTQHVIAGHQVQLDGDRSVCRAHAINVHVPEAGLSQVISPGNEYRFELRRTESGWRICSRQRWIRWRSGNETDYDVDSRLGEWSQQVVAGARSPDPALTNA